MAAEPSADSSTSVLLSFGSLLDGVRALIPERLLFRISRLDWDTSREDLSCGTPRLAAL
ncbi:MAG: hypothetical protein AVDCRST_MAG30-1809 [uncultured Solirubrobacteraceae bacterium]|uniref:Uncharacterized protein n=1 Tax=uncultured Solirubrobacteraceae bacterium TaxID=1162706 RepID=A0A6J4SNL8_9ACTN|nr:MAG: hypothetical protein AVDCRST_MAG30-1809 [uncultured Solirubrobacteraceae bacterium]